MHAILLEQFAGGTTLDRSFEARYGATSASVSGLMPPRLAASSGLR